MKIKIKCENDTNIVISDGLKKNTPIKINRLSQSSKSSIFNKSQHDEFLEGVQFMKADYPTHLNQETIKDHNSICEGHIFPTKPSETGKLYFDENINNELSIKHCRLNDNAKIGSYKNTLKISVLGILSEKQHKSGIYIYGFGTGISLENNNNIFFTIELSPNLKLNNIKLLNELFFADNKEVIVEVASQKRIDSINDFVFLVAHKCPNINFE